MALRGATAGIKTTQTETYHFRNERPGWEGGYPLHSILAHRNVWANRPRCKAPGKAEPDDVLLIPATNNYVSAGTGATWPRSVGG